ncbi:MAG: DedA family protein [Patescibacteria group bacterium]|jgi:membrane protein DedA with SNARE-associated domain
MFSNLINWILNLTSDLGYLGIGILMAIESSFLPLPSEIVIPPAAYLASQGRFNIFLIIIAGTIGSVLGATVNYLLSLSLGRLLVYKLAAQSWARWLLITPEKIARAEKYFLSSANSATFFGRLIPVVRHLISIPAGFSRMPYGKFALYTALGSALWVSILAVLGYFIGANQELIVRYYREIYWTLLVLGIIWILRLILKKRRKK